MFACERRGITCILTNQIGSGPDAAVVDLTGVNFSSVIDTVILLQFVDAGEEIKRRLLVMKSRGSAHSNRYHFYRITGRGIEFTGNREGEDGGHQ